MNLFPSKPEFGIHKPKNETIRHNDFLNLSDEDKKFTLETISKNHYDEEQDLNFDHFYEYFGINLPHILKNKDVLDLGCSYGGKSVSMAERWQVSSLEGIDVNPYLIEAGKLFSSNRKSKEKINFKFAKGEDLPYDDSNFDAIVSFDVFEHVQSLEKTLSECKRVIKEGGFIFSVFPSYFTPTEAHLNSVTRTPCLQWFFDAKHIQKAYDQIIHSRPIDETYWYYKRGEGGYDWAKLGGGIGINGTTVDMIKEIAINAGFSRIKIMKAPILSVGHLANKYNNLKQLSKFFKIFTKINLTKDFFTHRIVTIFVK